jgi:hypothetical protein
MMDSIERKRARLELEQHILRKQARRFIFIDLLMAFSVAMFMGVVAVMIGVLLLSLVGLLFTLPFLLHAAYLEWRHRPFRGGRRMTREEWLDAQLEKEKSKRKNYLEDDDIPLEALFIGEDGEVFFSDEPESQQRSKQ